MEIDQAVKDILYSSTDEYMEIYGNDYDKKIGVIYYISIADIDEEGLIPIDVDKYSDKCIKVKIGNTNSYKIVECPDKPIVDLKDIYSSNDVKQKGVKGVAYLNPADISEVCNEDNSTIGSGTSGCMKWYIYDDSGNTYKMILDHNTTATVAYETSRTYKEYSLASIKSQVDIDTAGWESNLNPRLITVDELAQITNTTTFTGDSSTWFYFDGTGTNKHTKASSVKGASPYAWLFDYTKLCTSSGCDIEDSSTSGYWTSSPVTDYAYRAWLVYYYGEIMHSDVYEPSTFGIRPVIEVSKTLFN